MEKRVRRVRHLPHKLGAFAVRVANPEDYDSALADCRQKYAEVKAVIEEWILTRFIYAQISRFRIGGNDDGRTVLSFDLAWIPDGQEPAVIARLLQKAVRDDPPLDEVRACETREAYEELKARQPLIEAPKPPTGETWDEYASKRSPKSKGWELEFPQLAGRIQWLWQFQNNASLVQEENALREQLSHIVSVPLVVVGSILFEASDAEQKSRNVGRDRFPRNH